MNKWIRTVVAQIRSDRTQLNLTFLLSERRAQEAVGILSDMLSHNEVAESEILSEEESPKWVAKRNQHSRAGVQARAPAWG